MFSGSSLLLQVWACAAPVLATLLFAPMLVCAQPGVWLVSPVAAIVRSATPAQIAQFRSTQADTPASIQRKTRPPMRVGAALTRSIDSQPIVLLAVVICQASPRAP